MLINLGGELLEIGAGHERVMAVINVTPDSFFAGSRRETDGQIADGAEKAVAEGASIIDLGAYSSRPGAEDISPEEEFDRASRGFRMVREITGAGFPVSVDTFRSEVVRRLYDRFGSFIVNDISAGDLDPAMIPTVAQLGLPYIAMHMRGTPRTMKELTDYAPQGGVVPAVTEYFTAKLAQLREAGIKDIILDPGFGFAKTVEQNFRLLAHLDEMAVFGLPVLAGLSRKTMIWKTLGITPAEALNGTTVLNCEALRRGASILRVHDVREAVQAVELFRALRPATLSC